MTTATVRPAIKGCPACHRAISIPGRGSVVACPSCGSRFHLLRGVLLTGADFMKIVGMWIIAAGLGLFALAYLFTL